ncbi:MAG TPA: carboxypeptidase-like regulatory domain-containing protein, partial [Terriglobales bacterium]|nr:carboxypeptidase-like regulatory domain-containing protein [Terriglobales bacterium]
MSCPPYRFCQTKVPPERINLLSVAAVVCLAALLHAQIEIGTVAGTVSDPSHARVADARVILQNPLTGSSRQEVTDDHGGFEFENVPYGAYILR